MAASVQLLYGAEVVRHSPERAVPGLRWGTNAAALVDARVGNPSTAGTSLPLDGSSASQGSKDKGNDFVMCVSS
jgi:hypothetical protein